MFGPYFWLALFGGFALIMLLIVPLHRVKELLTFGIIFGFLLGVLILFTGATLLPLFRIKNELIPIQSWGLSIPLAWFSTVIIFAYYLPKVVDTRWGLYAYILFWALGTTLIYLTLKFLGYWQDNNWNWFYNLLLALSTHTIMAAYLYKAGYIKKYRRKSPIRRLYDFFCSLRRSIPRYNKYICKATITQIKTILGVSGMLNFAIVLGTQKVNKANQIGLNFKFRIFSLHFLDGTVFISLSKFQ